MECKYEKGSSSSPRSSCSQDDQYTASLLTDPRYTPRKRTPGIWQWVLYATIAVQFVALSIAVWFIQREPALAIWCMSQCCDPFRTISKLKTRPKAPAKDVITHKVVTSTPYFENRSPYLGTDTARVDALWEDLYDGKQPPPNSTNRTDSRSQEPPPHQHHTNTNPPYPPSSL